MTFIFILRKLKDHVFSFSGFCSRRRHHLQAAARRPHDAADCGARDHGGGADVDLPLHRRPARRGGQAAGGGEGCFLCGFACACACACALQNGLVSVFAAFAGIASGRGLPRSRVLALGCAATQRALPPGRPSMQIDAVLGDRKPTFEDWRELRYTTRVINESMRLYPQPPVLIRWAAPRAAGREGRGPAPSGCALCPGVAGGGQGPAMPPAMVRPALWNRGALANEELTVLPSVPTAHATPPSSSVPTCCAHPLC